MTPACLAFCFAACLALAQAEDVTRAWHLAVPPDARDAVAISEALAPSVFTSKGDQLMDLSKALKAKETFGKGAWIVWNGTRHLLVVHGNRYTLDHADNLEFLREPHQVGITLAWYRGIGPGESVPVGAKAVYRSEIVGRSCQRTTTRWEHPDAVSLGGIEVNVATCSERDSPIADAQMSVEWQEKREAGTLRWDFTANFNTEAQGRAERVISQVISSTGERWTITANVRDLLLDGAPASERRWIETAGRAEPVPYRPSRAQMGVPAAHRLGTVTIKGATLSVAEFDIALSKMEALLDKSDKDPEATPPDPFAVKDAATTWGRPSSCKDAILPEELKSYAPVSMWDVRSILNGWGLPLAESDCAAYDPRLGRLVVAFQDAQNLERMEQLLTTGYCWNLRNLLVIFRGAADGAPGNQMASGAKLLTRGGQKAMLHCRDQHDNILLAFETEAKLGPSEAVMDAAYDLKIASAPHFPAFEITGSATAVTGAATSIHANEFDGKKAAVTLTLDADPVSLLPEP